MERALDALDSGSWVTSGLQGTRGATYGPVPTWFYQSMLVLTSDLRWVAWVKISLVTVLTGTALLLLGRSLAGVSTPLGAFAFLSPYLWFYSRDLWDNSFGIPFTAMLLATYAAFHASGRTRWLVGAGLFGVLSLLTHLMTAPLVAAVGLHLLVSQRKRLRSDRRFALSVAALAVAGAGLLLPYGRSVSMGSATSLLWSPSPRSLVFAVDGLRIFTLRGFDYVIGSWSARGMAPVLVVVSCVTYAVGLYGLLLLNRTLRDGDPWSTAPHLGMPGAGRSTASAPSESRTGSTQAEDGAGSAASTWGDATSAVAGVVALTLVFFVLLANGKRLIEHPHYYSGAWIAFFLLWWWGMSALIRQTWARRAFCAQAGVMAAFLVGLVVWLHVNRGTRSLHYGPTLANQMEVAAELERLGAMDAPPSSAPHPRLFPQAIRVLRRLDARARNEATGQGGTPVVGGPYAGYALEYALSEGSSGAIVVRRRPPR